MKFPEVDAYVSDFEQLVRKALYTLGSPKMNQHFIAGLPMNITKDVLKDPKPITYPEILQKTLASIRSKQTIWALFKKGNPGQNNNYRQPQTNWRPQNLVQRRPIQFFLPNNYCTQRQGGWNMLFNRQPKYISYNSSNAPRSMQNTPVPMDLSQTRAFNCGRGGRGNFRRGRGQYGGYNNCFQGNANATMTDNTSNACFQCEEVGHYARECPQRQRHHRNNWQNRMANLIDLQDSYPNTENTMVVGDDPEPLEALHTRLNTLSFKDREKLANVLQFSSLFYCTIWYEPNWHPGDLACTVWTGVSLETGLTSLMMRSLHYDIAHSTMTCSLHYDSHAPLWHRYSTL